MSHLRHALSHLCTLIMLPDLVRGIELSVGLGRMASPLRKAIEQVIFRDDRNQNHEKMQIRAVDDGVGGIS